MSITEKAINIKEIEEKIFREVCKIGCEMLKSVLEEYDGELCEKRDKKTYRHKGIRKTVLKTVMGEVEYSRAVYECIDESGIKKYVYLLDEKLGLKDSGFFSGLLSEYIVKASCESSYRNAAGAVSSMTGQRVSHTAAWSVVQSLGEKVNEQEKAQARLAAQHKGIGKIESKVLFEEQDGIWLKLQGKSREKYGASKEMKLAIAYDGAEKNGKKRYRLTNKVACANFENAESFVKRKEGVIAHSYCTDEIEMRFLNGDGAEWIKNSIREDNVYFQLDTYHRNKAIISYVHDAEKRKVLFELLYSKRTEDMFNCIEAYINCSENESEITDLKRLYTYFNSNKEGLTEIHRRGLNIPKSEDKIYRHMGCMESNIFSVIGNRMKGRRACWSIKGGNNMARILCLKMTGKLSETLEQLTAIVLPQKYADREFVYSSASKVPQKVGSGYNGFVKAGAFPSASGYKILRQISYDGFKA